MDGEEQSKSSEKRSSEDETQFTSSQNAALSPTAREDGWKISSQRASEEN